MNAPHPHSHKLQEIVYCICEQHSKNRPTLEMIRILTYLHMKISWGSDRFQCWSIVILIYRVSF